MNQPWAPMCSSSWTPSHLPPPPTPLGHPSAPALSMLSHASNLDWQSISHMIIYMFQCHSPKSCHLHPLPQSPKDCSIHLCLFCCLSYRVIVTFFLNSIYMHSVQFSRSVVSNSLRPHESQHTRPPCPSPTPGVHSDSRPLSQWYHPAISSSVIPFSSCLQSLPASESFPMSQLFTWGGQSTPSFPILYHLPEFAQTLVNWVSDAIQPSHSLLSPSPPAFNLSKHQGLFQWVCSSHQVAKELELWLQHQSFQLLLLFPLGLTGLIPLWSKGLSRVFSNTTVWKYQFFSTQPSLWTKSHTHVWLLEEP